MNPRLPLLPAIAVVVIVLLVVVWAFGPREEGEAERVALRPAAGPTRALLKDRALPPPRAGAGQQGSEGVGEVAVEVAEVTPTPRGSSKRERFRARRGLRKDPQASAVATEMDVDVESGLPEDGIGAEGPPNLGRRPTAPPDSPYEGLSDEDLAELIVAMQRLRDSGALRRVAPEDYLRVMEIMPESRGLQDADRIFQDILGMSVGEWLAKNRGGETYILE